MVAPEAGLTVAAHGTRVTVSGEGADDAALWEATRAAFEAARGCLERSDTTIRRVAHIDTTNSPVSPPDARDITDRGLSKFGQLRDIAARVLADGQGHERREISKAVRAEGLNPNPLTRALDGHFDRYEGENGRPCYRDPGAVPGEPEWMRQWNEDQIAALTDGNGVR
jgi:hypothetical protein